MMEYKGYVARVEFDESANVFHGQVLNLRDVITFEGTSVDELREEFKNSVEDYLEFCAERGEEPEKPFSGKFMVRIDPELHRAAAIAAGQRGVSLNAWVAEAIRDATAAAQPVPQERIEHRLATKTWTVLQREDTVSLSAPEERVAQRTFPTHAEPTRFGRVDHHWASLTTTAFGTKDEWAES